jgi:hypothetical protein
MKTMQVVLDGHPRRDANKVLDPSKGLLLGAYNCGLNYDLRPKVVQIHPLTRDITRIQRGRIYGPNKTPHLSRVWNLKDPFGPHAPSSQLASQPANKLYTQPARHPASQPASPPASQPASQQATFNYQHVRLSYYIRDGLNYLPISAYGPSRVRTYSSN